MPTLGALLLMAAFAFGLAGTFGFFRAARGHRQSVNWARVSYICFSVLIASSCGLLVYYLVKGDFSYRYVYKYSSSQSPLLYLISAFWAGQQGTYLLWLLFLALLGYFLIYGAGRYANWAMVFYGLIISFFGLVLIVLSPFARVFPPYQDGAGLNPLLQDPWMAIHPPIIFLGYAAAALPCVLALAALIRKDYDGWIKYAFPGVVLATLMLGAGNIMGGFWAYKTLGWGGYWAWDPVENSSFIPWMISLSLVHGFLIERKKQGLRKTNLLLAILIFLLIIYGTFLTRSGILEKFSVHSFTNLGVNHYLIGFMAGFALLSLTVYFLRFKTAKTKSNPSDILSKETVLMVSVWLLTLMAAVVLIGTSWPLLTWVIGHPSALDVGFYANIAFPLAILMSIGAGLAPLLAWGENDRKKILRKTVLATAVAGAVTVVSLCLGIRAMSHLLFVLAASFAMCTNLKALISCFCRNWLFTGASLSHFGLGLMLVGILISSAYTVDEQLLLEQGVSATAFGADISYRGMTNTLSSPQNEIILDISSGNNHFEAHPAFFVFNERMGLISKPYIWRSLLYDRYFVPQQVVIDSMAQTAKIGRSEKLVLDISRKPAMNAVWGGAILLLLGLSLLLIRSLKELPSK